jgi:hypothetical protein
MAQANPWIAGPMSGFDAYRSRGWRFLGLVVVGLILAAMAVAKSATPTATAPGASPALGTPVSRVLMTTLETASRTTLTYTGGPNPVSIAVRGSNATGPVLNGPKVLYVGAEFCPYCAAERWAVVLTLLRFGQIHALAYMRSAPPPEVYPNTPTFTFYGARYTSPYLRFTAVETATRSDTTPLQRLTGSALAAFKKFNDPPYVPQALAGNIPFLDVADRYVWIGAPLVPTDLERESWDQIAGQLATLGRGGAAANANIQAVARAANIFTAAVCASDGAQPAAVCTAPGVVAAAKELPR